MRGRVHWVSRFLFVFLSVRREEEVCIVCHEKKPSFSNHIDRSVAAFLTNPIVVAKGLYFPLLESEWHHPDPRNDSL
jgi:hypothetical protein